MLLRFRKLCRVVARQHPGIYTVVAVERAVAYALVRSRIAEMYLAAAEKLLRVVKHRFAAKFHYLRKAVAAAFKFVDVIERLNVVIRCIQRGGSVCQRIKLQLSPFGFCGGAFR